MVQEMVVADPSSRDQNWTCFFFFLDVNIDLCTQHVVKSEWQGLRKENPVGDEESQTDCPSNQSQKLIKSFPVRLK